MALRYADLDSRPVETQTLLLADQLPQGRLWSKAYDADSTIGTLVRALALEFYVLEQFQRNIADEWTIGTAIAWLEDWEASVGLPNACLELPTDIDDRRELVRAMLTNFGGVHTKEEYENAGALLGYDVTVIPGIPGGGFPWTFPVSFFGTTLEAANTITIQINDDLGGSVGFPAPFPMTFGLAVPDVLRCFYEAVAPATDHIEIILAP